MTLLLNDARDPEGRGVEHYYDALLRETKRDVVSLAEILWRARVRLNLPEDDVRAFVRTCLLHLLNGGARLVSPAKSGTPDDWDLMPGSEGIGIEEAIDLVFEVSEDLAPSKEFSVWLRSEDRVR